MEATAPSPRYLLTFLVALAVLIALSAFALLSQRDFRTNPIDFNAMTDTSFIPTVNYTRLQREEIRLGFVETTQPFKVGMFGNHQVNLMGRRNFGPDTPKGYFFNYAYANLGLPEVLDYISYLADRGKLPTDTVIVQITTPNNDEGRHILTYGYELAPDLMGYATKESGLATEAGALAERENLVRYDYMNPWIADFPFLQEFYLSLSPQQQQTFLTVEGVLQNIAYFSHQALSYTNVASSIGALIRGGSEIRVVEEANCVDGKSDALIGLFASGVACTKADLRWAFRNDGSFDQRFQFWKPLTQNEGTVRETYRWLQPGDEVTIAKLMRQICDRVEDGRRKCVFLIPPVYETERQSPSDRILNAALALVPEITVVDDRPVRDRQYFHDYDHPNETYFERLTSVLRERGLVPGA